MIICGIDYGSKLAGTSVLCSLNLANNELQFKQSSKKKDADKFLKEALNLLKPTLVFIDAPLSLPKVYQQTKNLEPTKKYDFFYRVGDRELHAMSPLFLGGLTARAMRLQFEMAPLSFYETYPAQQARRMELSNTKYKKKLEFIPEIIAEIIKQYPIFVNATTIKNWHEVDALLALIGAYRFFKAEHITFGDELEGLIYI